MCGIMAGCYRNLRSPYVRGLNPFPINGQDSQIPRVPEGLVDEER